MLEWIGQKVGWYAIKDILDNFKAGKSNNTDSENADETDFRYDIFIAAPMSSAGTGGQYKKTRASILNIKTILMNVCKTEKVFFSGEKLISQNDFDDESLSLVQNINNIKDSKFFILIFPEYQPSSTLIETGVALALEKESIWFLKKGIDIPFLLRDGNDASERDSLPRITSYYYDSFEEIEEIIKKKSDNLFTC